MRRIISLENNSGIAAEQFGGKAAALAALGKAGIAIPRTYCLGAALYSDFMEQTGLRPRVMLELDRKPFEQMRWEEIWDAALRIRNMFARAEIPRVIRDEILGGIPGDVVEAPMAVRSSAPGEDSAAASFAGLHDSFVNVTGREALLENIKLVWASLWTDRALLYRKELGLDVTGSAMAVVVQEVARGEVSGIVFGRAPGSGERLMIEAVHGLNQGLVDGAVEPDNWKLNRAGGGIVSHNPPQARQSRSAPSPSGGARIEPLPQRLQSRPPLSESDVRRVYELAVKIESVFGAPQDIEWTMKNGALIALQARPITSGGSDDDNERKWHLSLTRSLDNLKELHKTIVDELLPAMDLEAGQMAGDNLSAMSDTELSASILNRDKKYRHYLKRYYDECIPFAHGVRLFGQFYNDTVKPGDPFEFVGLLGGGSLAAVERNRKLEQIAHVIRNDEQVRAAIEEGRTDEMPDDFTKALEEFRKEFSGSPGLAGAWEDSPRAFMNMLLEFASAPERQREEQSAGPGGMRRDFLDNFEGDERQRAEELLELARESYRLRDDDNIYLNRIESGVNAAVREAEKRLRGRFDESTGIDEPLDAARALRDPEFVIPAREEKESGGKITERARQLTGQPAGPGIATATARVIEHDSDLFSLKKGEILVCDAIDPDMTFAVPLAAGIVERRGGMLIHGAIVAREYGIPCVTGVHDAASKITTGDTVAVDGYLGIVTIHKHAS